MAKHHPDLIMCRKQPGIAIGRLCEKCKFCFLLFLAANNVSLFLSRPRLGLPFKMLSAPSVLPLFLAAPKVSI
jgi:hypothetical protein